MEGAPHASSSLNANSTCMPLVCFQLIFLRRTTGSGVQHLPLGSGGGKARGAQRARGGAPRGAPPGAEPLATIGSWLAKHCRSNAWPQLNGRRGNSHRTATKVARLLSPAWAASPPPWRPGGDTECSWLARGAHPGALPPRNGCPAAPREQCFEASPAPCCNRSQANHGSRPTLPRRQARAYGGHMPACSGRKASCGPRCPAPRADAALASIARPTHP